MTLNDDTKLHLTETQRQLLMGEFLYKLHLTETQFKSLNRMLRYLSNSHNEQGWEPFPSNIEVKKVGKNYMVSLSGHQMKVIRDTYEDWWDDDGLTQGEDRKSYGTALFKKLFDLPSNVDLKAIQHTERYRKPRGR